MKRVYPASDLLVWMRAGRRWEKDLYCELAERLGVAWETPKKWRERGRRFTMDEADHFAIRAGIHPFCLWPEMVDDILAMGDVDGWPVCAAERCVARVEPSRRGTRFCSDSCRWSENARLRRLNRRCPVCGVKLGVLRRADASYCSKGCKFAAYERRRKQGDAA